MLDPASPPDMLSQEGNLSYFHHKCLQKVIITFLVTLWIKKTDVFIDLFKDYLRRSTNVCLYFLFFYSFNICHDKHSITYLIYPISPESFLYEYHLSHHESSVNHKREIYKYFNRMLRKRFKS